MFGLVIVVHVIACIFLIVVVLLQAGRGGGFSDMAGGGQASSVFGTQTNQFMTRLTEVFAVIFVVTSLSLAIMSSQRGKSLVEKRRFDMPKAATTAPVVPPAPASEKPAAEVATTQEVEEKAGEKLAEEVKAPEPAPADAPAKQ